MLDAVPCVHHLDVNYARDSRNLGTNDCDLASVPRELECVALVVEYDLFESHPVSIHQVKVIVEAIELSEELYLIAVSLVSLNVHYFLDGFSDVELSDHFAKHTLLNLGQTEQVCHIEVQ